MNLLLLNEIRHGRSPSRGEWVKHPTLDDEGRLEGLNSKFLALATKRRVPTLEEALERAKKALTWTEADERSLNSLLMYLSKLRESYAKVIEEQKKYLEEDLSVTSLKVKSLESKKSLAIGKVAESWATQLSAERYVLSLFYKDPELSVRSFSDDEVEMMDQEVINEYFNAFFEHRRIFSEESLKELACSVFCQNLYSLGGDPFLFFGKPVLELTCTQQKFMVLLENYKSVISNIAGKVNEKYLSDWKELEKWANSSERGREEMERNMGNGPQNGGQGDKINYENIKKASISETTPNNKNPIVELLS